MLDDAGTLPNQKYLTVIGIQVGMMTTVKHNKSNSCIHALVTNQISAYFKAVILMNDIVLRALLNLHLFVSV